MIIKGLKSAINFLPSIGVLPEDPPALQLRKKFMNSMALLMSNGGILWGGISLYFNLLLPAIIPLSYTVLTGVNLFYFHKSKNFKVYRLLQVLMSLALPFLFQWSLGGLIDSGAMMLWSFLALVGSMSVQDVRQSIYWLIVYLVLVIFSGFVDSWVVDYSINLPKSILIWFFVINIAFISAVIFGLMLYYIDSRIKAGTELEVLNATLEEKVKTRTNELQEMNDVLNNMNDELWTTINQVEEQSKVIELKNKNITDSLNYARRIQRAILSNSDQVCQKLKEYFIFFRPRDIVSGDFYWFHCDNDYFIAAAVDCTGHGVPGAFMSLIGDSLLNQIILDKHVFDPGLILKNMDEGVARALKYEENNRRDGMDMAIIVLNKHNNEVRFAGAKSSLVYIQDEAVNTIKGESYPIGGGLSKIEKTFNTQTITVKSDAMLYMYTDGFVDQVGGSSNRKYLNNRFREFLLTQYTYTAQKQLENIEKEFDSWKGLLSQVDDVLVLGIRI